MLVLGGVLLFFGLLLAGLAPVAVARSKGGRKWADEVSGLSLSRISDVSEEAVVSAIRGTVVPDEILRDPITDEPVVFFDVHADGPERTGLPIDERGGARFFLRDDTGFALVDPSIVHDAILTHEVWQTGDDRRPVARFLKKRGLANIAGIRIEHSAIAPDKELLVVGRPAMKRDVRAPGAPEGYRDGSLAVPCFEGGAAPLVLATCSLETFVEREVASAKSGFAGVVMLLLLGLGTATAGAAVLLAAT